MNILIIGGGGREHALAWKTAQSARAPKAYVAPGNAGTAREAKCENVAIAAENVDGLLKFAQGNKIDLTIVGPEGPLVRGAGGRFRAAGLPAGKGVIIAERVDEALHAVHDMLAGNVFGEAGHRVVVEEFLQGEEASFIVMADGAHVLALATSQDHKRAGDGHTRPDPCS